MSTDLETVRGKKEIPDPETKTVNYADEQLLITSFYGGRDRGICISLTIPSGQIQLTESAVEDLVQTLTDWLRDR